MRRHLIIKSKGFIQLLMVYCVLGAFYNAYGQSNDPTILDDEKIEICFNNLKRVIDQITPSSLDTKEVLVYRDNSGGNTPYNNAKCMWRSPLEWNVSERCNFSNDDATCEKFKSEYSCDSQVYVRTGNTWELYDCSGN